MGQYNIKEIHYRDIYGKFLWKEPMIFSNLYAIGDELTENRVEYRVRRVAVVDDVQHVNIERI